MFAGTCVHTFVHVYICVHVHACEGVVSLVLSLEYLSAIIFSSWVVHKVKLTTYILVAAENVTAAEALLWVGCYL